MQRYWWKWPWKKPATCPKFLYGTHFFQDLVEAQIIYLPVFPDDAATEFQREFFETAPNILLELFPHAREHESVLRLIDIPKTTAGALPMWWRIRNTARRSVFWMGRIQRGHEKRPRRATYATRKQHADDRFWLVTTLGLLCKWLCNSERKARRCYTKKLPQKTD